MGLRLFLLVIAVRLFLEVTGVGGAIEFAADGTGEFLHLAETFVLADKSRGRSFRFTLQRRCGEFNLELRVVDNQQDFVGLDW